VNRGSVTHNIKMHSVSLAYSQAQAIVALYSQEFDIIVLDLILPGNSTLSVADFASYRYLCTIGNFLVIVVTSTSFGGRIYLSPQCECLCLSTKQSTARESGGYSRTLSCEALAPPVRGVKMQNRVDRHDSARIDHFVAKMTVAHDMRHVYRISHAGPLI